MKFVKNSKTPIGYKHYYLTVIGPVFYVWLYNKTQRTPVAVCQCDCGNYIVVNYYTLTSKNYNKKIIGCGCRSGQSKPSYKHGDHNKKLYKTWTAMKGRCYNPKNRRYKDYGGKGIKVDSEWLEYQKFKEWAYNNGFFDEPPNTPRAERLSLDRRFNDKDYCPTNCRWTTVRQNSIWQTKARDEEIENLKQEIVRLQSILIEKNFA